MHVIRRLLVQPKRKLPYLAALLICFFSFQRGFSQSFSTSEGEIEETVNIGFLITQDPADDPLMKEVIEVVNLAIKRVNDSGGIAGKSVKLFVKSVDGNWGSGSKQAVNLITDHGTSALLGFVDGRSAHLIEQVCTKAQVPFISTFSADPTLSRINIPWFFTTMPHADQQAKLLAYEISKDYSKDEIAVLSSDDYDQGFIRQSFIREIEGENSDRISRWNYTTGEGHFEQITSVLSESEDNVIVFFGSSDDLQNLLSHLTLQKINIPVYTSINDFTYERFRKTENQIFTIRSKKLNTENRENFYEVFYRAFGSKPGNYSFYAYDGINTLIEAIRMNGHGSMQIRESLARINIDGVNGHISFDSSGVVEQELTLFELDSKESQ